MTVKEQLQQAVESMTDAEAVDALRTLARASGDPVAWLLAHAPLDDEPETEDERAAVVEAQAEIEDGASTISLADIKREFGLA